MPQNSLPKWVPGVKKVDTTVFIDARGNHHVLRADAERVNSRIELERILECVGRGGEWDHEMIIEKIIDKKDELADVLRYL